MHAPVLIFLIHLFLQARHKLVGSGLVGGPASTNLDSDASLRHGFAHLFGDVDNTFRMLEQLCALCISCMVTKVAERGAGSEEWRRRSYINKGCCAEAYVQN
jgi:hypothetical protein